MLYIIRHGKTDWNIRHKLQGRTDIPLNEEGRLMAAKARSDYADIHLDICYSSPLSRARETAEILLKDRNIPILTDDRLTEMSFGKYEGLERGPGAKDSPIDVLFYAPQDYRPDEDGGESLEQLFERTGSFLNDIMPDIEKGKDILIVGHGAMNSSIICRIRSNPVERFWSEGIENCVMKKLEF